MESHRKSLLKRAPSEEHTALASSASRHQQSYNLSSSKGAAQTPMFHNSFQYKSKAAATLVTRPNEELILQEYADDFHDRFRIDYQRMDKGTMRKGTIQKGML